MTVGLCGVGGVHSAMSVTLISTVADDVPPAFPSRRAERMQRHQPRLGRLLTVWTPG